MRALHAAILARPVGPEFYQHCPKCRRREFLEFKRTEPHELLGELRVYACKYCGHELAFARQLPPHVV